MKLSVSDVQTKKLLEYSGNFKINHLALRMLITRLRMAYKSAPDSLSKNTAEINALITKFPQVMKPDYDWIASL